MTQQSIAMAAPRIRVNARFTRQRVNLVGDECNAQEQSDQCCAHHHQSFRGVMAARLLERLNAVRDGFNPRERRTPARKRAQDEEQAHWFQHPVLNFLDACHIGQRSSKVAY